MALDIFSYRANSGGIDQQQPMCLTKANPSRTNQAAELGPHNELEQTPWDQTNILWPLESDGRQLLDPTKVSGNSIRSLTPSRCKDFDSTIPAVDDQHNPLYVHTELCPSPWDNDNDLRFRCFDHDCGGRTFSCAENYRRHVREKEGSAKICCTLCRVSFTRRSNLRKHVSERRCRVLKPCQTPGKASTLRSSHVPL